MEEEDDVEFIIEEFLENLESAEEEDVEASEDDVEAKEEDAEENDDELAEAGVYKTEEEYREERFMRLKEENLLLTDQLFCLHYKLEVLCRIVNIEKDNFEKEWDFFEEILFQEEEDGGKSNPEDIYLAKMYDLLREKFPLNEKKSQEDFRCLAIKDLRSIGIIELKKASEGQELKAAHDLEAFGMSENKDSDDLLLQIAVVEAKWNALTAVFSVQECKGAYKKFAVKIHEKFIVKEDEAVESMIYRMEDTVEKAGSCIGQEDSKQAQVISPSIEEEQNRKVMIEEQRTKPANCSLVAKVNMFIHHSPLPLILPKSSKITKDNFSRFAASCNKTKGDVISKLGILKDPKTLSVNIGEPNCLETLGNFMNSNDGFLAGSLNPFLSEISDNIGEFAIIKIGGEDIFESDLMWRRLIRSLLEQSLAALKSSKGFIIL